MQLEISRRLGLPLVGVEDLEVRDGGLVAHVDGDRYEVDVLYRRTDEERLAALVAEPLRSGRLGCANAFGAGVADTRLAHAHVEQMIDFYLGEPALLGRRRPSTSPIPGRSSRSRRSSRRATPRSSTGASSRDTSTCARSSSSRDSALPPCPAG